MRRLGGITDSTDRSLSELQEMVKNREAWRAAVPGATESDTTEPPPPSDTSPGRGLMEPHSGRRHPAGEGTEPHSARRHPAVKGQSPTPRSATPLRGATQRVRGRRAALSLARHPPPARSAFTSLPPTGRLQRAFLPDHITTTYGRGHKCFGSQSPGSYSTPWQTQANTSAASGPQVQPRFLAALGPWCGDLRRLKPPLSCSTAERGL